MTFGDDNRAASDGELSKNHFINPEKSRVKRACSFCKRSHLSCNDTRPCLQCTRRSLTCNGPDIERHKTFSEEKNKSENTPPLLYLHAEGENRGEQGHDFPSYQNYDYASKTKDFVAHLRNRLPARDLQRIFKAALHLYNMPSIVSVLGFQSISHFPDPSLYSLPNDHSLLTFLGDYERLFELIGTPMVLTRRNGDIILASNSFTQLVRIPRDILQSGGQWNSSFLSDKSFVDLVELACGILTDPRRKASLATCELLIGGWPHAQSVIPCSLSLLIRRDHCQIPVAALFTFIPLRMPNQT